MFWGQLPKLHGNVEGVVYITISIICGSRKQYACSALRRYDDADFDGIATCTSTITYRTRRYIDENRSRHYCCLL